VAAADRAHTRLSVGIATVALATVLALAPLLSTQVPRSPLAWLGAVGVLLAAGAVWRHPSLAGGAVVALTTEYGLSLYQQRELVDARAPLFATGLLLLVELAFWSAESHRALREDRQVVAHRLAVLAVVALAAVALAALVLIAAELPLEGPVARLALGVAAASMVIALIAALSRGRSQRR
jgi:nicotinamide riboside transporter PnuC